MNNPIKNAVAMPINESINENDDDFSRKLDLKISSNVVVVNNVNTITSSYLFNRTYGLIDILNTLLALC